MENNNKNQQKGSSSITTQLFGPPESDILASIFPPKKMGGSWQKESSSSGKQSLNNKLGTAVNKERSSIYHQEGAEPSNLSSSLYYGGQETYSAGVTTRQLPSTYPRYKKDGGEDDRNNDARSANWWQGSLYY